jgi:hypothetical protein
MATRHAIRFGRTSAPMLVREMGEPVIYYANGGLTGRCIEAIVERDVDVPISGDQVAQALIVRVLDSCTHGISSTEINDGKDEISVPLKVGGPATRRSITRRLDDANGMIRFMVR